jgi:ferredoxin-NADP reductase/MOSC domain-containing protein YiiM/ferredoxin
MPRLVSLNVGLPQDVPWRGEIVHTAIWKQPVQGGRTVRRLNIEGDGQGDLGGHGGLNRAVMVYQLDSYRHWERELGRSDFTYGQFGENFTVDGLADDEVCIGDRYRIGTALFEVSQPRVTCYRLGIRVNEPRMPALVVSHHRPGFYLRVLEEGVVTAGDEIVKIATGPETMTVAEIDALLYLPGRSSESLQRALRVPALSAGWRDSFQTLLDAENSKTEPATPAWTGFRQLRVARIEQETASVTSFYLEAPDGSKLPVARPGQFLVVRLNRPGAPAILRSYSLSGDPESGIYRISVKQETDGAGSGFLHTHVQAGAVLEASAPSGTFTLTSGGDPVVLVSAGIGVTPVLAMLHTLASERSGREVWWLFGARSGQEHPFAKEARELLQSIGRHRSFIVYSQPGASDEQGSAFDARGHLGAATLKGLNIPQQADFYLCGPDAFLKDLTAALVDYGVPSSRVRREIFGKGEAFKPGIKSGPEIQPHAPTGSIGAGPAISFTRSGLTVPWDDRFHSLLELAEACDVPAQWSCRTGVCHTCECALIGGEVEYDPDPLEAPQKGNLLICCSRPRTELQIDL